MLREIFQFRLHGYHALVLVEVLPHLLGGIQLLRKGCGVHRLPACVIRRNAHIFLQLGCGSLIFGLHHIGLFLPALFHAGQFFFRGLQLRFQAFHRAGQGRTFSGNITVNGSQIHIPLRFQSPEFGVIAAAECLCPLNATVLFPQPFQLPVFLSGWIIVPAVIVIASRNILGNIGNESLLVADIPVDVLPRLEIDSVFRLNIIQDLKDMLGVIDTLRDLTELLFDPVHIPLKFNEVQDLSVLLLTGELRKLHRIQLERREDLGQELSWSCLKHGAVPHLHRAGGFGGQGLPVNGQSGIGLNDDFALIGALVNDIVPVRTVGEGITDGIQHRCLSAPLGAGDLHGLPIKGSLPDAKQVFDRNFCGFH